MTIVLERPASTSAPDRERMAHILRDGGRPFPSPALCGFVCTRWADQSWPLCDECAAIERGRFEQR